MEQTRKKLRLFRVILKFNIPLYHDVVISVSFGDMVFLDDRGVWLRDPWHEDMIILSKFLPETLLANCQTDTNSSGIFQEYFSKNKT